MPEPSKEFVFKERSCPNCGGSLDIDFENELAKCTYCGAIFDYEVSGHLKEIIEEKRAEEKLDRDLEKERLRRKESRKRQSIRDFKSGKLLIVAIVFVVIGLFYGTQFCLYKAYLSGICAYIQSIVLSVGILMGLNVIKVKNNNLHVLLIVAALISAIPIVYLNQFEQVAWRDGSNELWSSKRIDWDSLYIKELPIDEKAKGKVVENNNKHLKIELKNTYTDYYEKYLEKCRNNGFVVDERYDDKTRSTIVFNNNNYRLEAKFNKSDKRINLEVEAPMRFGKIDWPHKGLRKVVPKPQSDSGLIVKDETGEYPEFFAYIANTSETGYEEYVNRCLKKGYDYDSRKEQYHFRGERRWKYYVYVDYYGNNIMTIKVGEK